MKKIKVDCVKRPLVSLWIFMVAVMVFQLSSVNAEGAIKTVDGGNSMASFPGGTWDFNNTALWTTNGDLTRRTWNNNADIAVINLPIAAWGSVIMTVDNNQGAVGASGVIVTNMLPNWTHVRIEGGALTIGESGVTVLSTNQNSFVYFYGPVVLATNQVWRNANSRSLDSYGTVQVSNVLSSLSGVSTPIVFDGLNRTDPGLNGVSSLRTGFGLRNNNTFHGSTTVSGGAALSFLLSTEFPGQKIDAASPLILNGGTLMLTGNSASFTQSVSSVVIKAGANNLTANNASGAFFCNSLVRDGIGGTVNATLSWSGGVTFYTTTTNENAILGGWATCVNQNFANVSSGAIGGNGGTSRSAPDVWGNNENIKVNGSGICTKATLSPYSILHGIPATNDLANAVLTVKSGGIMSVPGTLSGTSRLMGGKIRTGMNTGELFVYAFKPVVIDSVIEDNGTVPCILVKGGSDMLSLSGASTYSGDTYLNSGTLSLTGSATLAGLCRQAGGTTLSVSGGASLFSLSGGRVLGGNLALGGGALLKLDIGAKDAGGADVVPLSLSNPYASLTVTASQANPATVVVSVPTGAELVRRTYRLISWKTGTAVSGLSTNAFTTILPYYAAGYLSADATGLDLVLTSVSKGTVIVVK